MKILRIITVSIGILFFTCTHSFANGLPRVDNLFNINLSAPQPLLPSGGDDATQVLEEKFSWTKIKDADKYVLYVSDGGKSEKIQELSQDKFECNDSSHVCTTLQPIKLAPATTRFWAIRAVKGNDEMNSNWSKIQYLGEETSFEATCIRSANKPILTGDFPSSRIGEKGDDKIWSGEWSVGTAILAQAIRYDFGKKKAALNPGLGAGASFRFYHDISVNGKPYAVSDIASRCRAKTFEGDLEENKIASMFSISPVIYASQIEKENNLKVSPAIMIGFFQDILNVGVGFNLSGDDGDVGDVFLLLSAGVGFQF